MKLRSGRTIFLVVSSVLVGLYRQFVLGSAHSVAAQIEGIPIQNVGEVPYLEAGVWILVTGMFVLLGILKWKEQEEVFLQVVVREGSYRKWWFHLYQNLLLHTILNILAAVGIWVLLDIARGGRMVVPFKGLAFFVLHLLSILAATCLFGVCSGRAEWLYIPLLFDGGTLFFSFFAKAPRTLFFGTWGMLRQSSLVNTGKGFDIVFVTAAEILVIVAGLAVPAVIQRKGNIKYG